MAKILSQEEIDALLTSVSQKNPQEVLGETDQKVLLYDFKHPNLVSKEQLRLLETIHEGLCRNFSVFLSAQLRMIVEMNLFAVDQLMYSEFLLSIAPPSCIYVVNVPNHQSQFVLEFNPQLAIFIVERLFGGRGDFSAPNRAISIIEQRIMKKIVDRIIQELVKNWEPVSQFKAEINRFESNPEFVQIVPATEPVVVVSMEIKIQGNSSLLNISYPYMWLSGIIASAASAQDKVLFGAKESSAEERKQLEQILKSTKVPVRAILGTGKITAGDLISLKQGDVVKLDTTVDQPLPILVNNRHLFDAAIGMKKRKYACKIVSDKIERKEDELG